MRPLLHQLLHRIRLTGPVTVAEYMAEALGHPEHGYYRHAAAVGAAGDFVTAPEVSQMFGELVGLWCVACWEQMGSPQRIVLAELGPGRGTLLADALRAARLRPAFLSALHLHLVESNDTLRAAQAAALPSLPTPPVWHADFAGVPDGPLLLVANEFFDALPVHQFERTSAGWRERLVAVGEGDRLEPALGMPSAAFALLSPHQRAAPAGSVVELSPAALQLAAQIGARLRRDGGAALLIDYGYAGRAADAAPWPATLRGIKGHAWHDPFDAPGAIDLTADVDFDALGRAATEAGASVFGPLTQAALLRRLGIEVRAERLRARAGPAAAQEVDAALHRLLAPDEMGTLFKALALVAPGFGPPPGFEESDVFADRP